MAMALGHKYWLVPQISTRFFSDYDLTDEGIAAVVDILKHVMRQGASRTEL